MEASVLITLIAGVAVPVLGLITAAWWHNRRAIEAHAKDLNKAAGCLRKEIEGLNEKMHENRLKDSKEYASVSHLQEVEGRLEKSIQGVELHLEKSITATKNDIVSRLDKMNGYGK